LVDVRISASYDIVDLEKSQIDLAIRFGPTDSIGGTPLFEEVLMPLCSPTLTRGRNAALKKPADLKHHTLLATDTVQGNAPTADWEPWLKVMGITHLEVKNTVRFTQYSDAVTAAVAGQGVIIGRLPLLKELIEDKRLIAPFRSAGVATSRGYFLLMSAKSANNRDALEFATWLRQEQSSH
jgi:LysR family transcriptional regulator, glycine cleavage system transcriptional activator